MFRKDCVILLCTAAVFVLLSTFSASHAALPGAPPPSAEMPDDLEKIRESGRLRVAIFNMQAPPFVFEKDGVLMGADVDMARDIAGRLGVDADFVRVNGSYNDIVYAVARNEADIGICELSKTLDRSKIVYFTRPYLIGGFYFITNRLSLARAKQEDDDARLSTAELAAFFNTPSHTVSTMRGSASVQMMEELFPDAKYATTRTWRGSANLVYAGRADAAILPSSAYESAVHDSPALSYKVEQYRLDIDDPLSIAVRPGLPDLLRWLNDYLDVTAGGRKDTVAELIDLYLKEDQVVDWWMLAPNFRSGSGKKETRPAKSLAEEPDWIMVGGVNLAALVLIWLLAIRRRKDTHWLLSPWTVLAGMVAGGVTGTLVPGLSVFASPSAAIYMNFWKLCVLPIMITTIITSVFRLLSDGDNKTLVRRMLQVVPAALILTTSVGVLAGVIGQPGKHFSSEAQEILVRDMGGEAVSAQQAGVFDQFMTMAGNIVPDNVLRPVVENKSLAVLFIALFFGIMLARNPNENRFAVAGALDAVLDAFTRMVRASLYLLPFALYALALDFTSRTGLGVITAVLKLVVCMTAAMVPPAVFTILALRFRLNLSLRRIVRDFGPMFLIAFSARSSVIALPIGLEALGKYRNINRDQAMAAFPLSLLICHSTYALFYALTPVFIGQVFGVEFTLGQLAAIALGAVLCTVAAIGTIGMSYVLLLSIVCTPLGLPLEPAVMVGMAMVAVLDPPMSAVQALFGCGLTAVLVEKKEETTAGAVPEQLPSS